MSTWAELISLTQNLLQDPSGVFHSSTSLRTYGEHAELLLAFSRTLYERTQTLTFGDTAVYNLHSRFPDFIKPVRVTVNNIPLRWTSLAAVGRLHRDWRTRRGDAESCFLIGVTILGFSPLPLALNAQITYLAASPTLLSTPAAGTSPVIDQAWHVTIARYMEAISLAKEAQYQRAATALKEFLALAKIARDPKFLEGLAQRSAQTPTRQVTREAND